MKRASLLSDAIGRLEGADRAASPHTLSVIGRLRDDDRTAEAVAAMTSDPSVADRIIACCIKCDVVRRDFVGMVGKENRALSDMDALKEAVTDIDRFIVELEGGPSNSISAYVALEPGESDYLRIALGRIAGLIDARKRVAAQTLPRIGATAKWRNGAETAAIGWLAAGISTITGQPHYQHVAVLAQAILDQPDISEDRVIHARKSRKDWEDPSVVRFYEKKA